MSDGYTALVTGASGYIATELVKQLLEKGYHVIATHRAENEDDPKVAHLRLIAASLPSQFADNSVPGRGTEVL